MAESGRARALRSTSQTRLGRMRVEAGLTQTDMAERTGLSASEYWRLEHNRSPHAVNLRALVNCALVLGVAVDELIEDEWREWYPFAQPRAPHDNGG